MTPTTTWTGGAILAAGVIIGLAPVSSHGSSCGSPYLPDRPSTNALTPDPTDYCDEVRSIVRAPALALTVIGGGIVAAAVFGGRGSEVDMTGHRTVLGRRPRRRDEGGEA